MVYIYIYYYYCIICTHTPCGQFLLGALDSSHFAQVKLCCTCQVRSPSGWDFNGSQRMGFLVNFIHII